MLHVVGNVGFFFTEEVTRKQLENLFLDNPEAIVLRDYDGSGYDLELHTRSHIRDIFSWWKTGNEKFWDELYNDYCSAREEKNESPVCIVAL